MDKVFDFTVRWRGHLVYTGISMTSEQVLDVLKVYLAQDDSIELDGRTMPATEFSVRINRRVME